MWWSYLESNPGVGIGLRCWVGYCKVLIMLSFRKYLQNLPTQANTSLNCNFASLRRTHVRLSCEVWFASSLLVWKDFGTGLRLDLK
jgi:hypothetical protein